MMASSPLWGGDEAAAEEILIEELLSLNERGAANGRRLTAKISHGKSQSRHADQRERKIAAHDFLGALLHAAPPLKTHLEKSFALHHDQLPPAQRAAFNDPACADAAVIIDEVFGEQRTLPHEIQIQTKPAVTGNFPQAPGREAAVAALFDPDPTCHVQTIPGVLTAAECAILRAHCDVAMAASQDGSRDNTDGLPDYQLNLTDRELTAVLHASSDGLSVMTRLGKFVTSLGERHHQWARVGIFLRRYSPSTRPFMSFHTDGNAYTANVALSASGDHTGGTLLCLVGGAVQACDRELGAVTVHRGDVCHAVAPVLSGVRYSLLAFFHDAHSEARRRIEEETETAMTQRRTMGDAVVGIHPGIQEL